MLTSPQPPAAPLVLVGSTNRVKIAAVRAAVKSCFLLAGVEVRGVASASGVPDQPTGDAETLRGAMNRIGSMEAAVAGAAGGREGAPWLMVAVEGGVLWRCRGAAAAGDGQQPQQEQEQEDLYCMAWAAVKSSRSGWWLRLFTLK